MSGLVGRDRNRGGTAAKGWQARHWRFLLLLAVLFEAAGLWLRAHRLGGNVTVRCRQGHLFTTLWIPGVSLKAARLGWVRLQKCPVGDHWSLITPVDEADLTDEQWREAREHRVRIP